MGEYDTAIADYTEAIRINPEFAATYNNRANAHAKIGENDEAIADLTEMIRLKPELAKAYNNRGNIYQRMGKYDKAIADYTEAIRIDPEYAFLPNINRGLHTARRASKPRPKRTLQRPRISGIPGMIRNVSRGGTSWPRHQLERCDL